MTDARVAVITGAASGIGLATAIRLTTDGYRLALADIDPAGLDRAVAGIGRDVTIGIPTDVSSFDACAAAVSGAMDRFGRLDVLVNCAGVWVEGPSDTMTEADWDRVVDVNLKGTFQMCRHAIPACKTNKIPCSACRSGSRLRPG